MVDGEVAYNIWQRTMRKYGVHTESWHSLPEHDRVSWQAVADELWRLAPVDSESTPP